MKILFINTTYKSGSTGKIVFQQEQEAISNGFEAFVAYGRNSNVKDYKHYKIGNKFEMAWHLLLTRIFDKHGLGSSISTKKLLKWIKKLNPDIIHLHNIHGYYLNYEILFSYIIKKKIQIKWTLHDCWTFTGHCTHYDYVECQKWKKCCFSCVQKKEYPKSIFLDNSRFNYRLKKELFTQLEKCEIIVPSQWLLKQVKNSFLKKYSVKLIYNTVNHEIFNGEKSHFREIYGLQKYFIILGVANVWSQRKGYKSFIELEKYLNIDQKIVLVGLNKKQIKNLPSSILGIERTENIQKLAEIYAESDVYFNPTLEENYPTTNLEARSSNIPVITYDSGGSSETIINYEKGFVIEKGNILNAVEIIQKLYLKKIQNKSEKSEGK